MDAPRVEYDKKRKNNDSSSKIDEEVIEVPEGGKLSDFLM